ncbi:3-phenylpropionate/cinnamic acid dioxygenase subunit beta [Parafrankia elaeagni]|uniref:3-phenylpropionate/cinnamic acid dioxygenase subunit beta n=1 Tax=Parafrankia elaeagni TaxID=222534 RepID=UPI0007C717C8|nr:3-phenylpropionate/cinnamic acid dioxygenase subunit beta [Parafrankia elaeagni]
MSVDTAATPASSTGTATMTGASIPVGDPLYNEVVQFLYEEARLLDTNRLTEWLGVLAPDLVYRAPLRVTVTRQEGDGVDSVVGHFEEDFGSLSARVTRLTHTTSPWAEDPPSRTRRFVTNILVTRTDKAEEVTVVSNLLVTRNRGSVPGFVLIPAERRDVVRRTPDGWRVARRVILLDESILSTPNLAIFL